MDEHSPEVLTALQAVRMASELCKEVRRNIGPSPSILKPDRSPVTIADFGSQAILCKVLKEQFLQDAIVAEEDSEDLRKPDWSRVLEEVTSYVAQFLPGSSQRDVCSWIDSGSGSVAERYWAIDPVDGTLGFLRNDQYAIALALIENGIVKLGLLGCPNLYVDPKQADGEKGCFFLAIHGKGSVQINHAGARTPLAVSKVEDSREASLTESVESDHGDPLAHRRLARSLEISRPSLKMDSQAKYGIVARGEVAFYLRVPLGSAPAYKEKVWDHAPGAIIVEEAGGKVTDMLGRSLDFSSGIRMERNHGIVASNGLLHDVILGALKTTS